MKGNEEKILEIVERTGDINLIAEIKALIEKSGKSRIFLMNCQI
jgi:ribosomal protein S28E/S33